MSIRSKNSCCTDRWAKPTLQERRRSFCSRRHGTAEIELALSIFVLLGLLFMIQGAVKIGIARLTTTETSWFKVDQNAMAGSSPEFLDDPEQPMVDGFVDVRPGMPNRMHVDRENSDVQVLKGNDTFTAQVGDKSAVGSPSWVFSGYPACNGDGAMNQQWFQTYADESHSALVPSLGLAPVWTP